MTNETVNINMSELKILIDEFECWLRQDYYSQDYCNFCGRIYGNLSETRKSGGEIKHNKDCPVPLAEALIKLHYCKEVQQ